jgi:zinc protease
MKRSYPFLAVLLLLAAGALNAAVPSRTGETGFRREAVTVRQLDNGLKILLYEDHDIPNIAYYTFFRVGSRNERPGLTGVSHFIEHMMFNGSAAFGPGEFDRIMEFNGGANNAYTSDDLTAYTNWFPRAALEKMMAMEADRMRGLLFDPQVLESERGVVASERRLGDNDNDSLLDETVRATAIMAHPYHWSVIGWMSDILGWRRDEIQSYFRTYYAPNNAVLIVVGDFETEALMALIRKYYGDIPRGTPPPAVTTSEPPQIGPRRVQLRKAAQIPSFLAVYHVPAVGHADFAALSLLETILLRGESSRLYRRLVSDAQLAIGVSGGVSPTIDPFLFYIQVKPRPGADLELLEKTIEEELTRLQSGGVTPLEMEKALNAARTGFYAPLQTIAGKANMLGQAELVYGGFANLFTIVDRFAAVTPTQVQDACRKYLSPDNKTVGTLVAEGGAR